MQIVYHYFFGKFFAVINISAEYQHTDCLRILMDNNAHFSKMTFYYAILYDQYLFRVVTNDCPFDILVFVDVLKLDDIKLLETLHEF